MAGSPPYPLNPIARLKLFWALSRTPHGLLDMCTPAFGALLWLGYLPPWPVVIIGLITTFAGYTAVYALNDVIDYRADKEKAAMGGFVAGENYLDGVLVRHPMAQGLLSFKEGLAWASGWSVIALVGAYLMNPFCVLIFLGGCLLEAVYCLLWRVSPYRTIVSGGVKTSGAIAAVFAVDPNPSGPYLLVLFLLLFSWEIGGQNIPADWTDMDEDRRLKAKTIPVFFGLRRSRQIVLITLAVACGLSISISAFSRAGFSWFFTAPAIITGGYLLLWPAIKLYQTPRRAEAMSLFNLASYYPPALLVAVIVNILAMGLT
jgi:4-hydroxybenzoate polyprenyltransferase